MKQIPDYWLCKLFYDLYGNPALAAEYRKERANVLSAYALSPSLLRAVLDDDMATLLRHSNGFLLRYYFQAAGLPNQEFMQAMQALKTAGQEGARHG